MVDDSSGSSSHVAKLDTTAPQHGRIWNHRLDGKNNHAVDREAGDQIRYRGVGRKA
ncbi:SAM-dependent methyltransferase [Solwaraspora sp. WMMB335]|uniref:SAM-dependent methyltransferase n=1 Tax=Solwaraspora sp. WMMB335 TaxID=3404118 RepID=UPI003B937AAA